MIPPLSKLGFHTGLWHRAVYSGHSSAPISVSSTFDCRGQKLIGSPQDMLLWLYGAYGETPYFCKKLTTVICR
jgi:hypothetical protein